MEVDVDQVPPMRHLLNVRPLRNGIVALLALVWVPLTTHCKLECVPGLEFLRCSTEAQSSNDDGDPCENEVCCAIESAHYQSPRQQEICPVALEAILPVGRRGALEQGLPEEVSLGLLTAAPPEIPTSWQFSLRAALPVRAPSLASS